MKCPTCLNEMEQGRLRHPTGPVYFLPEGEKPVRLFSEKNFEKKRTMQVPEGAWPVAYCCRTCELIVVPCGEDDKKAALE